MTPAQRAILEAIAWNGYVHGIDWGVSRTTRVPGYPHPITDTTLQALRRAGLIVSQVIQPGGVYPGGHVNKLRVSQLIYVPKTK